MVNFVIRYLKTHLKDIIYLIGLSALFSMDLTGKIDSIFYDDCCTLRASNPTFYSIYRQAERIR